MKRIVSLFLLIALGSLSLSAQQKKAPQKQKGIDLEKFTMGLSLETDLPILNMKGSGIGPGAAFHLDYRLNDKIALTGNFGYNHFLAKSKGGFASDYQYYLLGGSYFVQPAIHVDLFAGYASFKGKYTIPFFTGTRNFNNSGPAAAVGAGYRLTKVFDISARFQKSKTVSFIGLSLAIRFAK